MKKIPEWVIRYGIPAAVLALGALVGLGAGAVWDHIGLRPASGEEANLPAEDPGEGIGRVPAVVRYLADSHADEAERAWLLDEYTEGDSPVPVWWNPDEEMAAEWIADVTDINVGDINVPCNAQQSDSVDYIAHPPIGIDPGGIDWNVCSTVWGWDGHGAELWELDLMARVFYLEFWGTSLPCSEAGCDAILNLWDSGKYGRTLFEALSYYDPKYGYTYEVYPWVWETKYDAEGLAWCREFCEERFINGPEWSAVYFQLGGYHDQDWVPALYEMDGVYFSGASEG